MMCNSLFYNSNNKNKQETCASKIRNQHVISRKREREGEEFSSFFFFFFFFLLLCVLLFTSLCMFYFTTFDADSSLVCIRLPRQFLPFFLSLSLFRFVSLFFHHDYSNFFSRSFSLSLVAIYTIIKMSRGGRERKKKNKSNFTTTSADVS